LTFPGPASFQSAQPIVLCCICSDFANQKQAQEFFEANGGPQQDPHRLDGDGDRPRSAVRLHARTSTELLEGMARRSGAFPTFEQWCEWIAPRVGAADPHDHPVLLGAIVEASSRYTLDRRP
jgi:hypothetical protein